MGLYDSVPVESHVLSQTIEEELTNPFDVLRKHANSKYSHRRSISTSKSNVFGPIQKI